MRILTWNSCGDIGQKAQAKAGELSRVLEYWESSDPIAIVCLQEVNAERGTLCRRLKDLDWQIKWIEEQADGGGRHQVIAVCPGLRIDDFDVVDLSEYEDSETIANSPCRTPCCADITLSDGRVLTVVTWHATLGSRKEDHLSTPRSCRPYCPAGRSSWPPISTVMSVASTIPASSPAIRATASAWTISSPLTSP